MKRILFITQYSPETRIVGDMTYTWDILRALKHDSDVYVHVVAYADATRWYEMQTDRLSQLVDRVTTVPFHHLKPWQMTLSLYPAAVCNRASGDMAQVLADILLHEQYDTICYNTLRMAYLVEQVAVKAHKVYISHNVETEVSRSIYRATQHPLQKIIYALDYLKTAYWEKRLLPQFDAISAICSSDQDALRRYFAGPVHVVRPVVETKPCDHNRPDTGKIIVCGSFTWLPKHLNLLGLLRSPRIALLGEHHCRLEVVGRALPEDIAEGNRLPHVHVTGEVESVLPYYADAQVAVVPELAGGGFKLKIAEAVRHHLPIVAIRGAVSDNEMLPDVHYLQADNFDQLLDMAMLLAHDPQKQQMLVSHTQQLFELRYSLDAVSHQIRQLI